ncbi:MAG: cobalamin biosynthesis protein CbiG [Alphaproteobacteria bacterium]|nr:cobalamin biosynthesis protein CbiG [Alphaproteobacteria bacterium]
MTRLFQAYVMVDWSAASKPAQGTDSIWIGVAKRNVRFQFVTETHNPATRAAAAKLLGDILQELAKKGERTLLGFDFPLGFPRGTSAALKLEGPPFQSLTNWVAKEIKDKPDNSNNRFQVGAKMNRLMTGEAFPFWGAPAREAQTMLSVKRPRDYRPGDVPEFRYCEEAAKGASPVWKLYYQGSVGGQALTGLPLVKKLKDERGDRLKLWPFELGWRPLTASDLADVEVAAAEVYPSLLKPAITNGEIKDQAQVRALCEHFQALDDKGRLGAAFGPKTDDPRRTAIEQEEGWILGV